MSYLVRATFLWVGRGCFQGVLSGPTENLDRSHLRNGGQGSLGLASVLDLVGAGRWTLLSWQTVCT